jgi:hypothetical protein
MGELTGRSARRGRLLHVARHARAIVRTAVGLQAAVRA